MRRKLVLGRQDNLCAWRLHPNTRKKRGKLGEGDDDDSRGETIVIVTYLLLPSHFSFHKSFTAVGISLLLLKFQTGKEKTTTLQERERHTPKGLRWCVFL